MKPSSIFKYIRHCIRVRFVRMYFKYFGVLNKDVIKEFKRKGIIVYG